MKIRLKCNIIASRKVSRRKGNKMVGKFTNGETKYRLAIRKRNGNLTISKCVYTLEQARKRVRESNVRFIITDYIGTPI